MKLLFLFILYTIVLSVGLASAGFRSQTTTSPRTSRKRPTRLLILGATGGTGRQLIAQALERGYTVTAFVRDPSKMKVEHPQLKVLQGNVCDYVFVEAAVRDQEVVISALGHKRFFYPTRILSEGTLNLLRAMETHGVPRLVCETSLGLGIVWGVWVFTTLSS